MWHTHCWSFPYDSTKFSWSRGQWSVICGKLCVHKQRPLSLAFLLQLVVVLVLEFLDRVKHCGYNQALQWESQSGIHENHLKIMIMFISSCKLEITMTRAYSDTNQLQSHSYNTFLFYFFSAGIYYPSYHKAATVTFQLGAYERSCVSLYRMSWLF